MDEITYRPTIRQRIKGTITWDVPPMLVMAAWAYFWPYAAALIAAQLVMMTYSQLHRTMLTPDGITLHAYGKHRHIPWQSIRSVETLSRPWGTRVELHLADGEVRQLHTPITGPGVQDPDFDAKAATIQHWWMLHTGRIPARTASRFERAE